MSNQTVSKKKIENPISYIIFIILKLLGDILKIDNLVYSIIEFFDATLNCLKFQTSIKDAITELLYYCILFMQITEKHINLWTNDLGLFIDCDEEAPFSYTVRIAAQDFFMVVFFLFMNFKVYISKK